MIPAATAGGLAGLKQRALAGAVPLTVHLELTYRCPWRCGFCYNPRRQDERPLSLSEWEGVLDDLRRLGTLTVTLTGGEPLAHPEFFAVARAVRDRALVLRVFTNGHLMDEPAARRLAALRPLSVELSLHGATAATHDAATGVPGSFTRVLGALKALVDAGAATVLKVLFTRHNQDELDGVRALAESFGVPLRIDPVVTVRDCGDRAPLARQAGREGLTWLFEELAEAGQLPRVRRAEGGVTCGLGRLTAAVDPEGNVFPCIQWRHSSLGNVRDTGLAALWRRSPVRAEAAEVAREANARLLAAGAAAAEAPFCPAAAMLQHGDPHCTDESFHLRAGLVHGMGSAG